MIRADPGVEARTGLRSIFDAAIRAVEPGAATSVALRATPGGLEIDGEVVDSEAQIFLLAVGKAAAPMAEVFGRFVGTRLSGGLVVTKTGHGLPLPGLRPRGRRLHRR